LNDSRSICTAPTVTRGFWTAIGDLAIREAWVVAPVREAFPIGEGVEALPLDEALARLA